MFKINLKYYLIAIITISSVFIFISIQEGHRWGGDFSLYINQSIHITEGFTLDELYQWNKTSIQNSISDVGPYLYPIGFPLLLSPIYYFFGMDFVSMKIFCSLFFLSAIPFIYLLFRAYFQSGFYALIVACLTAFNAHFIIFSDNILSDFPYMFFCFLTLYLMALKYNLRNQLLLGFCLFFSYFIRDIGIFLLPTIFVYQITQFNRYKNKIFIVVPHLVFGLLFFLARDFFPYGSENHFDILQSEISLSIAQNNFNYYQLFFSELFFFNRRFLILGYLILTLAIIGAFSNTKKHLHFIIFTILNLGIIIIWPSVQGIRFLLTIYPFIVFFTIQGILFILDKINTNPKFIRTATLVYLMIFSIHSFRNTLAVSRLKSNQAYTTEMIEIYDYISLNITDENIIGFWKPRVLYLFTGVKSIYTDTTHFNESMANYLLIKKENTKEYDDEIIKKEFKNYILLKKEAVNKVDYGLL